MAVLLDENLCLVQLQTRRWLEVGGGLGRADGKLVQYGKSGPDWKVPPAGQLGSIYLDCTILEE